MFRIHQVEVLWCEVATLWIQMNCLRNRAFAQLQCLLLHRRSYSVPGDVAEGSLRKSPLQIQLFQLDGHLVVRTAHVALSMKTMFKWKTMTSFNRKKLSEHDITLRRFSMSGLEVVSRVSNVNEKVVSVLPGFISETYIRKDDAEQLFNKRSTFKPEWVNWLAPVQLGENDISQDVVRFEEDSAAAKDVSPLPGSSRELFYQSLKELDPDSGCDEDTKTSRTVTSFFEDLEDKFGLRVPLDVQIMFETFAPILRLTREELDSTFDLFVGPPFFLNDKGILKVFKNYPQIIAASRNGGLRKQVELIQLLFAEARFIMSTDAQRKTYDASSTRDLHNYYYEFDDALLLTNSTGSPAPAPQMFFNPQMFVERVRLFEHYGFDAFMITKIIGHGTENHLDMEAKLNLRFLMESDDYESVPEMLEFYLSHKISRQQIIDALPQSLMADRAQTTRNMIMYLRKWKPKALRAKVFSLRELVRMDDSAAFVDAYFDGDATAYKQFETHVAGVS